MRNPADQERSLQDAGGALAFVAQSAAVHHEGLRCAGVLPASLLVRARARRVPAPVAGVVMRRRVLRLGSA